jgi:hypothetical protein
MNLLKCKEIRLLIQKKVSDIIQRIRDEEAKLMDDVEDFERTEASLLTDKNDRLKALESMSEFGILANKILTTYHFFLFIHLLNKKNFLISFI